ncbi:hypothetical protein GYMLUDRAFT_44857 [Collybiopsis luxurians FD-317 M1]|uniref:Uncharacterized protein n=1 Tax=Collybiopsis luxurians FD-317 M1 TaxID=944289 RepID=A0A0D0BUG3_9AGAR|nr:hypothetical protein GYMLUDRAFT_44857 [Collybiopsis luxurians FD-317 M1]
MASSQEEKLSVKVVEIIDNYLASESPVDPSTSAKELTTVVESTPDRDDWIPHIIYDDILSRIRQFSHDNPIQHKLVSLLSAIKQMDSLETANDGYWGSLRPLGMTVRELWNTAAPESLDENIIKEWTSLNAFVARLTMENVLSFDVYGIWAMRYALEDDTFSDRETATGKVREGELNPEEVEKYLPAAAVWIIYAGGSIWELSKDGALGDSRAARGGPSWDRGVGYSVSRWGFWKDRFGHFGEREDLSRETRGLARRALGIMNDIDI